MATPLSPPAETEGVRSPLACFQGLCWTTWLGRRPWLTTFSTPSTGTSCLGECGEGPPSSPNVVQEGAQSGCARHTTVCVSFKV